MRRDTTFFSLTSMLMIASGIMWAVAGAAPLFILQEEAAPSLAGLRITGIMMMALAVFSAVCGLAGLKAVRTREGAHACVLMGTAAFSMTLLNLIFYISMQVLVWQILVGVFLGTVASVFYLIGAVIQECTGGTSLLGMPGHRKKPRPRR